MFNYYEIIENAAMLLVTTGLEVSENQFIANVERNGGLEKSIIIKNMELLKKKNPQLYKKAIIETKPESLKAKDAAMLMCGKALSNPQ